MSCANEVTITDVSETVNDQDAHMYLYLFGEWLGFDCFLIGVLWIPLLYATKQILSGDSFPIVFIHCLFIQ